MVEKKVGLGCAVAWGTTVAVVGLLIVTWFLPHPMDVDFGRLVLVLTGVAAVLHIRTFFVAQSQMLRNAFELGRDAAAAEVRRIPTPR